MNKNIIRQTLSGGQAVIKSLKIEGVTHVFGLIGSATMELFDALYDTKDIRFIDVRDERTGSHMADGYARASGKPGIIIAGQNGPGVTNLVTGIAQAKAAFSPVISIAGAITTTHEGKDAFQEVDQQSLFEPITKKTFTVRQTKLIPNTLKSAFKIATSQQCGPVQINLPRDILANHYNFGKFKKHKKILTPSISNKTLIKAMEIIKNKTKPVIIAGGGVKNSESHKEIVNFAKYLNIPIVSSAGHGDAIPHEEILYAGQMGPRGNIVATNLVKNADVIIALGTRLGFNSTFYSYENINKKASIIQVDIEEKSLGRYFPITLGICNDVKIVTKKLLARAKTNIKLNNFKKWTQDFLIQKKIYLKERDNKINLQSKYIQPSSLFRILRQNLPKDVIGNDIKI